MFVSPRICAAMFGVMLTASCSGLDAHGDACRFDDDCNGERVCSSDGVCMDPTACSDGAQLGEAGVCGDSSSLSCARGDASCYETQLAEACPGDEWALTPNYWTCEKLASTTSLSFFAPGWSAGVPLDVGRGPTIELSGHRLVELQIDHRFNPQNGASMAGIVMLVPEGADPFGDSAVELWRAHTQGGENVTEHAEKLIAKLPASLQERAQIVLLTGPEGDWPLGVLAPYSWDILHLRVQAK